MSNLNEAARQLREFSFRIAGRQPCCGATNAPCARPPGLVYDHGTGCEKCGHPVSCHVRAWSA